MIKKMLVCDQCVEEKNIFRVTVTIQPIAINNCKVAILRSGPSKSFEVCGPGCLAVELTKSKAFEKAREFARNDRDPLKLDQEGIDLEPGIYR